MTLYTVNPIRSPHLGRLNVVYLNSAPVSPETHFAVVGGIPFVFVIDASLSDSAVAMNRAQREVILAESGSKIDVLFIPRSDFMNISILKLTVVSVSLGKRSVDSGYLTNVFLDQYRNFPFFVGQFFYFVTDELTLKATVDSILCDSSHKNLENYKNLNNNKRNLSQSKSIDPHKTDSGNIDSTFRSFGLDNRDVNEKSLRNNLAHSKETASNGVLISPIVDLVRDRGVCSINTAVTFTSETSNLTIEQTKAVISASVDLRALGIGGLSSEFSVMFRRAFVQRCFDSASVSKLGLPHVKGILLHGPPGTGKTLIARQIGQLLNARQPKIVSGPEILSKYVGESEANVRALFEDAEKEYKSSGDASQLHVIIFDELDAVFRSRGSSNVGDQVVNQLLAKMDGVDALNNILIVGLTNRPDIIDKALLRPGRFEVHLEIGLPNENGRTEILEIHTQKMRKNGFLHGNVDCKVLAAMARNFTGAELQALVKSATSFALERSIQGKMTNRDDVNHFEENKSMSDSNYKHYFSKQSSNIHPSNDRSKTSSKNEMPHNYIETTQQKNCISGMKDVCVTMDDFMLAFDEVTPALGFSEKEFITYKKQYHKIKTFEEALITVNKTISKLRLSASISTTSILFYGKPGTGKTTTAVRAAIQEKSPYIKIMSPKDLVGMNENEKVNYIKEIFTNAAKSSEATVILDEIETLIDFVAIGPRFSNAVLQAIKIFTKLEGKNKTFILGTTSNLDLCQECGIEECFQIKQEIREISQSDYFELQRTNHEYSNISIQLPASIKSVLSALPIKNDNNKNTQEL